MKKLNKFWADTNGDAVVEATILFPIMIMIFAGLVLLAMYLPTRAVLQYATQYAATALATERSDTWLYYDEKAMKYEWEDDKKNLNNVYVSLVKSFGSGNDSYKAQSIVESLEKGSISTTSGILTIDYDVVNYIIYKEIIITATRTIPSPVDLSFVGFPKEIPITVTSTAVVQNGDEFIRNMDIAVDFIKYLDKKYEISSSKFFEMFSNACNTVIDFLDIGE